MMDIVGSLAGLILTGFLTILIGPFIIAADPGPVFYAQKRVGKNGKVFTMYKFRSMYRDAEKRLVRKGYDRYDPVIDRLMYKRDDDPRILGSGPDGKRHGIGWFIRRTSLDEFPQFLNCLKGDMSLVGTRPPTLEEYELYEPHHKKRLEMRPGLTGLWQVSGRNNIEDFEEIVKLDLDYIRHWTIRKDLQIILKTFVVMFTGEGAR